MLERPRRPTAADVARLSGVSTATVSYVLNRTPGQTIPASTCDRVLAAAQSLGYVPSAHAQALARGRTRIVLVDLSDLPHGERISAQAREFAAAIEEAGYIAVVAPPGRGGTDHTLLRGLASVVTPFAVLTTSPLPEELADELQGLGVHRLVSLSSRPELDRWIGMSAREQIRFLQRRGHERIGYWSPADAPLAHLAEQRRLSAEDESRLLGLRFTALGAGTDPDAIVTAVRDAGVTAVATYNDEVAFPVLAALHGAGIRVPDDVAVIGIDDHPLAAFAIPALTTVTYQLVRLGGPDAIVAALEDGEPLPVTEGPQRLVVVERASA
ncbi:LacI family DNA-binding transcriptional regulator [Microbacterium sp. X-17]|uniref:LacI family DNA-binding transcriptional regulator n=1 Tax=Microbacterium sp. X-17 TaxID=3144404 RepID=UPI0031F5AFB2